MTHLTIPTIERAWFLFKIPEISDPDALRAIARSAWYEVDQQYASEPDIFIVRADVVDWAVVAPSSSESSYNIIAPASARPKDEEEEEAPLAVLFARFHQALSDASCIVREEGKLEVDEIEAAIAMVQRHTPFPPHNNAPGYIPTSEQMSADGPLRDNRWG